ncbi:MAG TPA: hypothetical protein VGB55_14870 [Tepidisphaeraceae bacterium]|jgi:hypothetical protein
MSETECRKADKEIEAAQNRLKRFVKKASECIERNRSARLDCGQLVRVCDLLTSVRVASGAATIPSF